MIYKPSLLDSLKQIEELTVGTEEVELREVLGVLSFRGYAALLIIFGFPIVIPGLSNLFGLIVAWIGIRIALAKKPWWPKWLLNKKITSPHLSQFIKKAIPIVEFIQRFLHPRMTFLTQNRFFYHFNGLLITILGVLMALPVPIPLTNIIFATPVLFMGLAFLEDDGLFVLIAYLLIVADIFLIRGLLNLGMRINSM